MTGEPIAGIRAVGAYAPRLRIESDELTAGLGSASLPGIERTAVPEADEDALTMAMAAGRRALAATGDPEPESIAFATTTPPLDEEDLTARLGSVLDVPSTASRQQFLGSTRAGTRALQALADGGRWPALVITSDCPRAEPDDEHEHVAGAGAAAVLLDEPGACPAQLVAQAEHAAVYPGTRFRERGSEHVEGLSITSYDRDAFTETIGGAVQALEASFDDRDEIDPDAVAIQAPDGGLSYRAASTIGVETEAIQRCAHVHDLGDTGAASVPLSLASALDDGAATVLCVSFGSGAGSDALLVERDGSVPSRIDLAGGEAIDRETLDYPAYLRRRGVLTSGPPDGGGAYVSVPSWQRSIPERHRLEAGRCPDCESLSYPARGACRACDSLAAFERVTLPGTGTIETVTTISQGGAPPEFAEQQAMSGEFATAIVAFDGPAGTTTASAPVQVTDVDPAAIEPGDRVEATIRRLYTQEGVTRYGPKVRPA
jgi:hydroxymethylglutaryl-CoA synthase